MGILIRLSDREPTPEAVAAFEACLALAELVDEQIERERSERDCGAKED